MPLPPLNEKQAIEIASQYYGLTATAKPLPGDSDRNFLLSTQNDKFILKIHALENTRVEIEFQHAALQHLSGFKGVPHIIPTKDGETIFTISYDGDDYLVRMVSYLNGTLLEKIVPKTPNLLRGLGAYIAQLDLALEDFTHPAKKRDEKLWDLSLTHLAIEPRLKYLRGSTTAAAISTVERETATSQEHAPHRIMAEKVLERFKRRVIPILPDLHQQVIHYDANTQNLLVQDGMVNQIFDFGDLRYAPRIFEVAICAAYALLGEENPLEAVAHLVAGYHSLIPLTATEISLLYDLICARIAVSASISAEREGDDRYDAYHQTHAKPAWEAMEKLLAVDAEDATSIIGSMCPPRKRLQTEASPKQARLTPQAIIQKRENNLSLALSLSYKNPLHIVRGQGQFLYDTKGKSYLDCVNNVCHVGHSHPRVVAALAGQAAVLNTNTRYLHENIVRLAERLTATMPPKMSKSLSVCFFVNSGSEANDLALRLARAYTGERDMLVLEGAYHGNLSSLVEISPYKFDGVGGTGAPSWVHKLAMPCSYRSVFREAENPMERYALQAQEKIDAADGIAAFISESMIGTGGQIVFPEGYLAQIYEQTRAAGGICIADEVQNGFGRFGTHFWGFESHGVVPDIVVMGKPMGNGHPLAAVVTRPEIAAAFNNGMEYFNTFGGNPVSCAVGLAMLDVIEDEKLQENALHAGAKLRAGLLGLKDRYPLIGDVRGEGLFLGIELVRDRSTLEPASAETHQIVEEMRNRQILLSVDGPLHNVIKIKPPIVFNEDDAARLVRELDAVLSRISAE
ncbi:MAG: aminotransferase class III-fold pyridoxal phosphate-dependent enzyme [Anaerolineae bacterium]|nr:aminotransferase class III-fold pyridoxal phosphate-dependent enzyme [Anaerolineae bacterium]MBT4309939.1 aminotransferase class III-fold pyridoxal phosphate-dependent enzyme [Anaerolineae bacterium]MBT4456813.1 aminotransferase class III-fold pyridoxal phosphate-dependent enzyme [Anaerolineae bacterium]MBT4842409.1 aminotransferase class III-fold pyridoxal phosphate-dependent enzyme [Anaerolineae bacterium]MBT6060887.1 aminotransferase class III-fold pyridoxal phosphate-dependent enzyme [An